MGINPEWYTQHLSHQGSPHCYTKPPLILISGIPYATWKTHPHSQHVALGGSRRSSRSWALSFSFCFSAFLASSQHSSRSHDVTAASVYTRSGSTQAGPQSACPETRPAGAPQPHPATPAGTPFCQSSVTTHVSGTRPSTSTSFTPFFWFPVRLQAFQ